jgi:tRNA-uridine 2-sulfurtransferase
MNAPSPATPFASATPAVGAADFQLSGPLQGRKIVVAMSGGVDSSVVAALAARTGAETIGVTLQLYDHGAAVGRSGSCCAGQDIRDARAVAEKIGIAHYVFDYESRFRESVMEDFASEYMAGRTPIPCVKCNMGVKFTDLFALARDLGADCLATGHYVRRVEGETGAQLHRALDDARDQSYFLFATTQDQLDYLRFPLGGMPKGEVRAIAQELGLGVAMKPDSQDICFVPDGDYAKIVRKLRPDADADGEIVHIDGRVLGRHRGLIHYTVGQRKGLEIGGLPDPVYVIRLDPVARRVIVGPRSALAVASARLSDINWLGGDFTGPLQAKVRSLARPVPARLENGTLIFASPEYGVAPGQAAVLYDGERVLGGGWIAETFAADSAASTIMADPSGIHNPA